MSDPSLPRNPEDSERPDRADAAPEPREEYDLPLTAAPRPRLLPADRIPGAVRALIFVVAAGAFLNLGSAVGLFGGALLMGQRIPTGPELVEELTSRPGLLFFSGLGGLLGVLLVTTACLRAWHRRQLASIGLQVDARSGVQLAAGFALGALLMTGIFLIELAMGWVKIQDAAPVSRGLAHVAIWLAALLPAAAYEELMLRGYTFQALEEQWGGAAATALTAIVFAALHAANPNAGWSAFWGITASGILFGVAFLVTRRLWLPIGLHVAWNLFEGPLFGFPVSGLDLPSAMTTVAAGPALWTGGEFGPEAGLLSLLACLVGIGLLLAARRKSSTRRHGDTDGGKRSGQD